MMTQVLPFWFLGIVGLLLSMWATSVVAARFAGLADHHVEALLVNVASVAAYGLVWGVKFVVLTTMVFNQVSTDADG